MINALVNCTAPIYSQLTKDKKEAWNVNIEDLRAMPQNSLGYELSLFLDKNNIHLMPKLERHDVFHVLTEYGTSPEQEARMQWWLLGNRKFSFYTLGTVFISIIFFPDQYFNFIKDFKKGLKAQKISIWNFEYLLFADINILKLNIHKTTPIIFHQSY